MINFNVPPFIGKEKEYLMQAVDSHKICGDGQFTKKCNAWIEEKMGAHKALLTTSGSTALDMAAILTDVGPGDEVILPAYTYTATASIVYHVGATPVMIDCKPGSYEMDYDKMEAAINERTKVIIPVDLAGVVCDYDRIYEAVRRKRDIFVPNGKIQELLGRVIIMADAAHAFGAQWHGQMCGEIADFTNFSFHAVKNLTTAEGGATVHRLRTRIDEEKIYKQYMLWSLHGQTKDAFAKNSGASWEYDVVDTQYKCNMPDVLAAIGLAQLNRYEDMLKRRHALIEYYNDAFKNLDIQVLNHADQDHRSSGHLYFVRFNGKDSEFRNAFYNKMAENGVMCNVHFKPLPMMTAYKNMGFDIKDYPNAYAHYKNEITLPLHTKLSNDDVKYVIECYKKVLSDMKLI